MKISGPRIVSVDPGRVDPLFEGDNVFARDLFRSSMGSSSIRGNSEYSWEQSSKEQKSAFDCLHNGVDNRKTRMKLGEGKMIQEWW